MATPELYIETPLVESYAMSKQAGAPVYLKLENTQPSYTFKLRGISNLIIKKREAGCTSLVASSGGNAGLAAAYTARKLNIPITIYVPGSTPPYMRNRLSGEGAEVIVHGDVWDDANKKAMEMSTDPHCAYIHPYDHPDIWEGHASMMVECATQLTTSEPGEKPGLVVCSVGGGGLMIGVLQGMRAAGWADVPLLAMETVGADCMNAAIKAGELVTLPTISSIANTLGAKRFADEGWRLYKSGLPIISEVITDKQAVEAIIHYSDHHKTLVEPACGAALAAVYSDVIKKLQTEGKLPEKLGPIIIIVCGGYAVNLARLEEWKSAVGIE